MLDKKKAFVENYMKEHPEASEEQANDLFNLIIEIQEKRKEDGYTVTHKSSNKYSLEEAVARMIKSHL